MMIKWVVIYLKIELVASDIPSKIVRIIGGLVLINLQEHHLSTVTRVGRNATHPLLLTKNKAELNRINLLALL